MGDNRFAIREQLDQVDVDEIYSIYETLFSVELHHGGEFTAPPGRMYVNGKVNIIDLLDHERFSVQDLKHVLFKLGYVLDNNMVVYYHYLVPGANLDVELSTLDTDLDTINFLKHARVHKFLIVFVEHGVTNVYTSYLGLINSNSPVGESSFVRQDDLVIYDETLNVSEGNDSDDSDFIVDDENCIDDVGVDMRDFYLNVDKDAECINQNLNEVDYKEIEQEVLDNDDFDNAPEFGHSTASKFYVGQEFGKKDEIKKLIKDHAVETRRQLKIVKDDHHRVRAMCHGQIPTFEVNEDGAHVNSQVKLDSSKCSNSEGPQINHVGRRGKRKQPDLHSCPWVMLASKVKGSETWKIKTLVENHKCLQTRSVSACTHTFLSKKLIDQLQENRDIPVNAVQEQFQKKLEIRVSKMKTYRAKTKAMQEIHGDYDAQYALLWDYATELMTTNPGSTVKIDVEPSTDPTSNTRTFRRMYVCLGPLKEGFKAIGRDLLGLDGAFIKGPYPGQILSAVSIDPNNGIYPLCYAIVEAETTNSWTWFLNCLADDLDLVSNSDFTFMSDRQKGIIPAIAKVFPCAEHRFCLRHILENMKLNFRGKAYKDLLWKMATSTTGMYFQNAMQELQKLNTEAHMWLSKIPPKHWSRSHFSGRAHSDVLLNNMCEVFNAKIVDGRDKPIIKMLEYIRVYLMRRIVTVLKVIEKSEGFLTPTATKLFESIKKEAAKYTAIWNGGDQYQVSGPMGNQCVVDMRLKVCSCRKWEITGMPCKHAVASMWDMASNGQQVGLPET